MQQNDPDMISIQFKVAGRRVLLRNAMIGSALTASIASMIAVTSGPFYWPPILALIVPILAGAIMGSIVSFFAWLGHIIAQHDASMEFKQPLNGRAILYGGLMAWWISIIGACTIILTESAQSWVGIPATL